MQLENIPAEVKLFELMKRIRKLGLDNYSLEEIEVSPAQMALLDWIATNPGCGVQDIADGLELATPTVSISIRKLEQSGTVERRPNPLDRRGVKFFLTQRGQVIHEKIQNSHRKKFHHLLSGLSAQEQETLLGLLEHALQTAEYKKV
jgi:DNA-binding MarR family transcriptional regulator